MDNPRVTITVRRDLYESMERLRAIRGETRSHYYENAFEEHVEAEKKGSRMNELEERIGAVEEGMQALASSVQGLAETLEESAERVAIRLMDIHRATLMTSEIVRRTLPEEMAKIDREEITKQVEATVTAGEMGRRN